MTKLHILPNPNETKTEQIKRKAKTMLRNAGEWCNRNKETIIILAPVVIGGLTTMVKVAGKTIDKNVNLRKEEELKNLYCYDPSLGHYWALRRKLSNQDWVEIDQRKANGERLAEILTDLNVLK